MLNGDVLKPPLARLRGTLRSCGGPLLVLDRRVANERGKRILTRYGLARDRSPDLDSVPASPH
jgi:hypothetical protein